MIMMTGHQNYEQAVPPRVNNVVIYDYFSTLVETFTLILNT